MSRLIPLTVHSAIEVGLGAAIMAAPFVFGLSAAALVTAFLIGAIVMGMALAGSGQGRGSIPVAAHAAYDGGIAFGLLAAALVLGFAGDAAALVTLAVAGLVQVVLNLTTRYSAPLEA